MVRVIGVRYHALVMASVWMVSASVRPASGRLTVRSGCVKMSAPAMGSAWPMVYVHAIRDGLVRTVRFPHAGAIVHHTVTARDRKSCG